MTIRGDGDVIPCCSHIALKMPMGNLYKNSIKEIWNNKKFVDLRKTLTKPGGYKKYKICKQCIETSYNLEVELFKRLIIFTNLKNEKK